MPSSRRIASHLSAATVVLAGALDPHQAFSQSSRSGADTAIFAGGCFWCMVHPFDTLSGVVSVTSGYTGGNVVKPTYEQVSSGGTGHVEAVQIVYDPKKVPYDALLPIFWHNVDPLNSAGQFCDYGEQYKSAIFSHNAEQQRLAQASKEAIERSGRFKQPLVTRIMPAGPFYPAEEYHQDYYKKNPVRYRFYRWNCGRDQRLKELWGAAAGRGDGPP